MQKFDTYENEKYEKGNENGSRNLRIIYNNLVLTLKIILCLLCEPFIAVRNVIRWLVKICGGKADLKDQVALVTGSANGLGRAIAFRLAQEKCKIAVADINLNDAWKTAMEIKNIHGVDVAAFKVDVSNVESIKQLKQDVESRLGPVDIVVS